MAKYLDPKADLTFKKVFAEHKELMISFLNALLPLQKGKEIVSMERLEDGSPLAPFSHRDRRTYQDFTRRSRC